MAVTFTTIPDEIAWSRHPLVFETTSDDAATYDNIAFKFELWKVAAGGDVQIGKTTIPIKADATKKASYDFSQQLSDHLTYDMPVLAKLGNNNANVIARYYVKCIEIINKIDLAAYQSGIRYALKGANDFFYNTLQYLAIPVASNYIWLTAKPVERELFWEQEEIISVLFTADQATTQLDTILYYSDGTYFTVNTAFGAVLKGDVKNIDLSDRLWDYKQHSPAKTIVRIEVEFNTITGVAINQNDSKKLVYTLRGKVSPDYRDYHFYNNYGGIDCLPATGQCTCQDAGSGQQYRTDDNLAEEIADETVDFFTQHSGFIRKTDRLAYKHLRNMRKAWYVMPQADFNLNAIAITAQKTTFDNDGANTLGFIMEYTYGNGRQNFDLIEATEFTPDGNMALPIEMTDVTGLVAALLAKQPTEAGKGLSQEDFTTALLDKLNAMSDGYKQKHPTGAALALAHPAPQSDAWALVEDTDTMWVWDVDAAEWVDTGGNSPSVDIINDLVTGGVGKALSAQQGIVLKALIDALLLKSELDPIILLDNSTAWNHQNKVLGNFEQAITASLTPIVTGNANLRVVEYTWLITNSPAISLPAHQFTASEIDLLDDVAWNPITRVLTFSNGSGTRYLIIGKWHASTSEFICNIQKK